MSESHVISGLLAKRAELIGKINFHYKEAEKLSTDLESIEKSIKIIDPSVNLKEQKEKVYRQYSNHFKVGELSRLILGVLRDSEPMPANEIVDKIKEQNKKITGDILGSVRSTLSYYKKNGKVKEVISNAHNKKCWALNED